MLRRSCTTSYSTPDYVDVDVSFPLQPVLEAGACLLLAIHIERAAEYGQGDALHEL